jgi:hypothetical protein
MGIAAFGVKQEVTRSARIGAAGIGLAITICINDNPRAGARRGSGSQGLTCDHESPNKHKSYN